MIPTAVVVLSSVLAIGALVSAVRLVVPTDGATYLGGRSSDAAHLLMNAGMAAMLVVPAALLPPTALLVLYVGLAVVFAVLVVLGLARPSPARVLHRPAHVYHVVAASAMAWAVYLMPSDMPGMEGMPDMGGMPAMSGMGGAGPTPVAAWVLAGLFALDGLGTLALLRRLTDRVAVVPHVVMDAGMVFMLVPALLPG